MPGGGDVSFSLAYYLNDKMADPKKISTRAKAARNNQYYEKKVLHQYIKGIPISFFFRNASIRKIISQKAEAK